jgi:hypothetical protein
MWNRILRHVPRVMLVVLAAFLVSASAAQEPAKPEKKDPAESVESVVQRLQIENADLKRRVKALETQVRKLKENQIVTRVVPQPGVPPQVPPDWVPRRFNNGTFYLVPLGEGERPEAGSQQPQPLRVVPAAK